MIWALIWIGLCLAITPVFIWLLWQRGLKEAAAVVGLFLVTGLVAVVYTVINFGAAFGPGILFFCFGPLGGIITGAILIGVWPRFKQAFTQDQPRRRAYLAGGLLLIAGQLLPPVGSQVIKESCFNLNRQRGAVVIAAVEAYRQDVGQYPASLSEIVPDYLETIPEPACGLLSANESVPPGFGLSGFDLMECSPEKVTLLVLESVDGSSIQRYNFATGQWSSISFLDGACSFLK